MEQEKTTKSFSGIQVAGIVFLAMVLTMAATLFIVQSWLFPKPFEPVVLSQAEEQRLEHKLQKLDSVDGATQKQPTENDIKEKSRDRVQPEAYNEEGASRTIRLSERELNGLLAKNTDLAQKLAIDLADDLVSLKMIIPVDHDFPVLGGKTLKIKAGAELAYRENRPVVKLRGVSIMGVPVPNAWLGGLKNIDLIKEFGTEDGFWQTFAEGVDVINVQDGSLKIILKE